MPELSEVEASRRQVALWWRTACAELVLHDPKLLPPEAFAALKQGLQSGGPLEVRRRGKVLIVQLEAGHMLVHYRMTGKIVRSPVPQAKGARLAWRPQGADHWLVFCDVRRFGTVAWLPRGERPELASSLLARMGPEPHDVATADELGARLGSGSRRTLKAALLDQSVIAGVGNIAISELFWRCKLAPGIRVHELSHASCGQLAQEMPRYFDWLTELQVSQELAYLNEGGQVENPFSVYAREDAACPRCQASIARVKVAGRSSYFCPVCQA